MILETLAVGPLEVNAYVLAEARGGRGLVVDPGGDADAILACLARLDLTLAYIVNTHGHFDHVGANRDLKEATGAEILIHEADAGLLLRAADQAGMFGLEAEASPPADRLLRHGDRISLDGLVLEVVSTPGHTPGGICLVLPGRIFTGDTLFAGSVGRTDLPGGSFRELMVSIQREILPRARGRTILPGHGPATTLAREIRTNPFLADLPPPGPEP